MEAVQEANLKRINLGGTGEMYSLFYKGNEYLYKPAQSKFTSIKEPFRGIVQECAYYVQRMVDPSSAVFCCYVDANGLNGSIQKRIPVHPESIDFKWVQLDGIEKLTSSQIDQFMREFVIDYLLYNYDSHGGNFITDQNGVIRGIDKEQSFRYMDDPDAQTLSTDYSPNTERYGEFEPIYNTIFRAYSEGKIDIDYSVISEAMDRVDAFSNEKYREIFLPYCEACSEAFGGDPIAKLDKIVARKIHMRENIDEFYQRLTEKRDEKKY